MIYISHILFSDISLESVQPVFLHGLQIDAQNLLDTHEPCLIHNISSLSVCCGCTKGCAFGTSKSSIKLKALVTLVASLVARQTIPFQVFNKRISWNPANQKKQAWHHNSRNLFSQLRQPLRQPMRPYDVRNVGFLLTSKRYRNKTWICLQSLPLFDTEMINLFCLPKGFESGRRRAGVRSFEPLRHLSEVDFAIHQTARLWAWFAEMWHKEKSAKESLMTCWHKGGLMFVSWYYYLAHFYRSRCAL